MSTTNELFIALSPDTFLITADFKPCPREEADKILRDWVECFKSQGYYFTSNRERIPYDEIYDRCILLSMSSETVQRIYDIQTAMIYQEQYEEENELDYSIEPF